MIVSTVDDLPVFIPHGKTILLHLRLNIHHEELLEAYWTLCKEMVVVSFLWMDMLLFGGNSFC